MDKSKISEEDFHTANLEEIRSQMPHEEVLYDVAELFKVFSDSTRIMILSALIDKEMCVNHIAELLSMSQSAISHQLRVLKQARLVKYRRDGKIIYYSLCDNHIESILNMGIEHVME